MARSRQDIEQELDQLLVLIKETPGLSGSELARRMKLPTYIVRGRLGSLEAVGKIRIDRPPGSWTLRVTATESPPSRVVAQASSTGGEMTLEHIAQQIRQFQRANPSVVVTLETRIRS